MEIDVEVDGRFVGECDIMHESVKDFLEKRGISGPFIVCVLLTKVKLLIKLETV